MGHKVVKEFYINDAGSQMNKLGISLKIRCQQLLGTQIELPEDAYQGDYLIDIARNCIEQNGPSVVNQDDSFFTDYGYKQIIELQKKTLEHYGINFDVWFSERTLHEGDAIKHALDTLEHYGYLYKAEGAIWFKSTIFGDDKDRVIKKADGQYTYAAADIAYLLNKANRGFDKLIMVLGQDHHSYAVRLEAIRKALHVKSSLDVILYQLVRMQASGQLVKMSKRAGTIVNLEDVIETVGADVARFFYLNRKADAQLAFDLDLALKKTEENPVYYIQYAYVRTNSILVKAAQEAEFADIQAQDTLHLGPEETLLIKKIASLKELLESISTSYHTHQLTYYVLELATIFHRYYYNTKVLDPANKAQSRARLYLVQLVNQTLKNSLTLLGISCPSSM